MAAIAAPAGALQQEFQALLLLQQKAVRQCAYCALKKYGFGRSTLARPNEQAFWVLSTPEGLQCEFWDDNQGSSLYSYHFGVPAQAVALFHTHPSGQAKFSTQDHHEARRLEQEYGQGIAFFALAGHKFGIIREGQQDEPVEYWFSSSLWLDMMEKQEKQLACAPGL